MAPHSTAHDDAASAPLPTGLAQRAREWAATDPDSATAAQLLALVDDAERGSATATAELEDAFSGTLQFGTAGLRAALGPGPMRMNRVVVRRAAAGFAAFLNEALGADGEARAPRVVVGFDARHNSDVFARDSAAVFTAAGLEVFLMPSALPTPLLAYAVRALDADGGVMVTASHNPPQDNGYKVYLGGRAVPEGARGSQIVEPYDARIAAAIAAVGPSESIALAESGWEVLPASIEDDYRAAVVALALPDRFPERDLDIVLTPMHGVGGRTTEAVLRAAGFASVTQVAEQAQPDPDFPTVSFPNPEEPGALDLALALAAERGADVVLANDPDADRAAVAAFDPDADGGRGAWRMLRGDEVGALLGAHMADRLAGRTEGVFANSIVSSRLLSRIAAAAGYEHRETLTGFKWISRVPGLVYGYEEALGYCVAPELARDKDGISAALLIAELAAQAKAQGSSLFGLLDTLALEHGLHASDQLSVRVADLSLLDTMMAALRATPPAALAESAVVVAQDLSQGTEELPGTNGLKYLSEDGTQVIVRPSGTEPKLKCYLEVVVPVDGADALPAAKREARRRLDAVLDGMRSALGV
ncbi:phospho-sugar mutase [Arthrobacter woluwensis]|uniref:Phosphomannomutase n=1 Tax=Arthrobacter woluwensis TaxID=156980 RepID=A0A1H4SA83_9MICC|nr:phospho-sugar mutase [Arthrobacter woluwensis]SEC41136.1 phosphomannomutase [Arthrobacter woluwensis]